MNMYKAILICFLILLILAGAISAFIHTRDREGVPAIPQRAAIEEESTSSLEPSLNYAAPVNAIPTDREIEDAIKRKEEHKEDLGMMHLEIEKEKIKGIIKVSQPTREDGKEALELPSRKAAITPTREEEEKMRSQDIVAY